MGGFGQYNIRKSFENYCPFCVCGSLVVESLFDVVPIVCVGYVFRPIFMI